MTLKMEIQQNTPEIYGEEDMVPIQRKVDEPDACLVIPTRIFGACVVGGHVQARACVVGSIREADGILQEGNGIEEISGTCNFCLFSWV